MPIPAFIGGHKPHIHGLFTRIWYHTHQQPNAFMAMNEAGVEDLNFGQCISKGARIVEGVLLVMGALAMIVGLWALVPSPLRQRCVRRRR